jgi:hypothetical protein
VKRQKSMKKIDLKKELAPYYKQRRGLISVVDVPAFNFLMIDGKGDPNKTPSFSEAVETLYSISYTLKFMLKMDKKLYDYPVMALEGLWWSKDMASFTSGERDAWEWTIMILQPDFVTRKMYEEAVEKVRKKKTLPALGKERLDCFEEGLSIQILHVGPYSAEGPTIEALHHYAQEHGYALRGKHHEIYFGDPRKGNPENLKTLLRQPVQLRR